MGMRLGRLQQFYDDFCNLQFSPKYINQKINFGDVLQTCIRKRLSNIEYMDSYNLSWMVYFTH